MGDAENGKERLTMEPLDSWGPVFTQLGVAGILAWYLWYTTSVSFPKISSTHLERVDKICDKHDATMKQALVDFRSEIRDEREFHRESISVLADAVQKLPCKLGAEFNPEKSKK